MALQVKKLRDEAKIPTRATEQSAGLDLYACLFQGSVVIEPSQRALIKTGIAIALDPGMEAQVRPRSGLALKKGITVLNSPGTIDADYRGEVGVILINHSDEPVEVYHGDRVAQLVIQKVWMTEIQEVDELSDTERGAGGFGSTGAS